MATTRKMQQIVLRNMLIYFLVYIHIERSMGFSSPLRTKHLEQQQLEATTAASTQQTTEKQFDALVREFKKKLVQHSPKYLISPKEHHSNHETDDDDDDEDGDDSEEPCMEVINRNAIIKQSISRSSEQMVDIHPHSKFEIAYCASDDESASHCAVSSTCATLYAWQKAKVQQRSSTFFGRHFDSIVPRYATDEVLVPTGCTCLINSLKNGWHKRPIIMEY